MMSKRLQMGFLLRVCLIIVCLCGSVGAKSPAQEPTNVGAGGDKGTPLAGENRVDALQQTAGNNSIMVRWLQATLDMAQERQRNAEKRKSDLLPTRTGVDGLIPSDAPIPLGDSVLRSFSLKFSQLRESLILQSSAVQKESSASSSVSQRLIREDEAAQLRSSASDLAAEVSRIGEERVHVTSGLLELKGLRTAPRDMKARLDKMNGNMEEEAPTWGKIADALKAELKRLQQGGSEPTPDPGRPSAPVDGGTANVTGLTSRTGAAVQPTLAAAVRIDDGHFADYKQFLGTWGGDSSGMQLVIGRLEPNGLSGELVVYVDNNCRVQMNLSAYKDGKSVTFQWEERKPILFTGNKGELEKQPARMVVHSITLDATTSASRLKVVEAPQFSICGVRFPQFFQH